MQQQQRRLGDSNLKAYLALGRIMLKLAQTLLMLHSLVAAEADDTNTRTASCEGRCPESYFPGMPCYCNEACMQYENCCYDYVALCNPKLAEKDEWANFSGHTYKYVADGTITASSANKSCRDMGTLPVSINNKQEYDFIVSNVLRGKTLSAFIGGSDREQEGRWMWEDGMAMTLPTDDWHSWFTGEPNNDGGMEHCSVITNYKYWIVNKMLMDAYKWIDYICDFNAGNQIQGYICEGSLMCVDNPCMNGGTCVYAGATTPEYQCLCPQDYVGDLCQYQVFKDKMWTMCGETNLTSDQGVIMSPLYPKDYPANVRCQWNITTPEGTTISINLEEAYIEPSKDCFFDAITIYDDHIMNDSVLVGPLCGGPVYNKMYTSSSNKVAIVFNTDKSSGFKGFKLTYKRHNCGQGYGDSGCGTKNIFTTECGEVLVQRGPERVQEHCQWIILLAPGQKINLTFTMFDLTESDSKCHENGLEIYDGLGNNNSLVGKYCGHRAPFTILSNSHKLVIILNSTKTVTDKSGFHFMYTLYDPKVIKVTGKIPILEGISGILSISDRSLYSESQQYLVHKWHIKVPYGYHMMISWNIIATTAAVNFKIYKGMSMYTVFSQMYNSTTVSNTETKHVDYFQAIISINMTKDYLLHFNASFKAIEWRTNMSQCYRPLYFDNTSSPATENDMISKLQPVMLKISETSRHYRAGLYCKWVIRGKEHSQLLVDVVEANIYPMTETCEYDGFVMYDGPDTTYPIIGPFCGSSSLQGKNIKTNSSELLVVFYSDPTFGDRKNGKLRTLFQLDSNDCPVWQMSEPSSESYQASCGIVLSPNFPGLAKQGLWFWTYQPPENKYISIKVHYAHGPDIADPECRQSFKVIEISKKATNLRQREADLITLCGTTNLFIPPGNIKIPPDQKMGIELNTAVRAIPQSWQFKISFTTHTMLKPRQYNVSGTCPSDYTQWRGHCYRYYEWVRRHYVPDQYKWQKSWHRSLEQCEKENGTLLSITDEEEAYFLKYQLANDWFWYPAAPYGVNHRLIFLGLHNKHGDYEWTNGVQMSYADWYKPQPSWSQQLFYGDSMLSEIINDMLPQPSASIGSLCTGMIPITPFGSMNWVKIPCDYLLFRSGTICKQPVKDKDRSEDHEVMSYNRTYRACPRGYFMLSGTCITLVTNYVKNTNTSKISVEPLELGQVRSKCMDNGGNLSTHVTIINKLKEYLNIWNHTTEYGIVLVARNLLGTCFALKPKIVDNELVYEELIFNCDIDDTPVFANVICSTDAIDIHETCDSHEFTCDNDMCISTDSVCDTINDCRDWSDEQYCVCDETKFHCNNGKCLSLSLRCDYRDNCGDNSDEIGCVSDVCSDTEFKCDNNECIPKKKICNFRYDCIDGSDEAEELCDGRCNGFQCYAGTCLQQDLEKDGISDCPGTMFEDENTINSAERTYQLQLSLDKTFVEDISESSLGCLEGDTYMKCEQTDNKCYDRSNVCVFDMTVKDDSRHFQVQTHCRNGYHLRKHCENKDCPGMYHCPGSYCIPTNKVCDGRKDCPLGNDEQNCRKYKCPGFFRCKSSGTCIPHSEVCNGINDCETFKEDEKYCGIIDPVCKVCRCDGYMAFCAHHNITYLPESQNSTRNLRALFLNFNTIQLTDDTFKGLHWLNKLNLSNNFLMTINVNVFKVLLNLKDLDLSHNALSLLFMGIFDGLSNLERLDISFNKLTTLYRNSFSKLTSLRHLIIENNPLLKNVDLLSLTPLHQLHTLNSDAYKFCCIAKQVEVCTPAADEFSNCEDLMANYPLQICVWILGILATAGNMFVVIWRLVTDRQKVASLFIINLGLSDFLMGVYLLIIATVDMYYRGSYIVHADNWRGSVLCQIAGILAMLSSELSVFMLTTITVDRCIAIMFPLKFGPIRKKYANYVITTGWLVCLFLSVLPATKINYFGDAFFGRTGVCLPFQVSSKKLPGWEYSVFIFLVLNFVSFILIFVCYAGIFMTVLSSVKNVGTKATSSADEYRLAKKLVFIVATDFCCWVPIILIGFAALGGTPIPPQVSAWIAVFILPLNSAVNPLLYTISTIECKKKKKPLSHGHSSGVAASKATKYTTQ